MHGIYGTTDYKRSETETLDLRAGNRQPSVSDMLLIRENLSNQILAALPADALVRLLPFAETVDLSAGEHVYQPENSVRYVYFPETAVFSQLQILTDGSTIEIGMVGSEGVVGLQAVIGFPTSNCWTEASLAGTALKISSEVVSREFKNNGALHAATLNYVNAYIEQIFQKAVCNSHHKLKERFCSWLLMMQDRNKSGDFPLTQERIARLIGANRPSFSCIAIDLRKRNIIAYSRGKIVILDRRALEREACSCYSMEMKNAFFAGNFKKQLKLVAA